VPGTAPCPAPLPFRAPLPSACAGAGGVGAATPGVRGVPRPFAAPEPSQGRSPAQLFLIAVAPEPVATGRRTFQVVGLAVVAERGDGGAEPAPLVTTKNKSVKSPLGGPRKGARETPGKAQENARATEELYNAPAYVKACSAGSWHLTGARFDPTTYEWLGDWKAPFKCRSWRHAGPCRRWRASQNFARLAAALSRQTTKDICFIVLTLDPSERRVGGRRGKAKKDFEIRAWRGPWEGFQEMRKMWTKFQREITRAWGKNVYAATVEVTPAGWPHLNVVMVCTGLAKYVGQYPGGAQRWVVMKAKSNGFGKMATIERAQSKRAVAGYIVKVAGEVEHHARDHKLVPQASSELRRQAEYQVDQQTMFNRVKPTTAQRERLVGEVIKLSQLPMDAPEHFRRIRSSKGFLPPPFKRPGVTGGLKFEPLPNEAQNGRAEGKPEAENRERKGRQVGGRKGRNGHGAGGDPLRGGGRKGGADRGNVPLVRGDHRPGAPLHGGGDEEVRVDRRRHLRPVRVGAERCLAGAGDGGVPGADSDAGGLHQQPGGADEKTPSGG